MPVAPRANAVYNVTIGPRSRVPWVRGWNRLEGRPRSADFARSLRAEVRDPLWFLTRQWQYGEFEGDDAGSPIDARLAYGSIAIDGYATGDVASPYDVRTPLEPVVEREPVPFDLVLHMQASRILERMLRERGREARLSDYAGLFPLDYASGVAGDDTPDARALFESGAGFLFDTAQFVATVRDGSHASRIAGFPGLGTSEAQQLVEVAVALVAWFDATYAQPMPGSSAWRPEKLDYAFACTADGGSAKFSASDYRGGDLDWHAFDSRRRRRLRRNRTPCSHFFRARSASRACRAPVIGRWRTARPISARSTSPRTTSRGCCCRNSRCSSRTTGAWSRSSSASARTRALPVSSSPTYSATRRSCAPPTSARRAIGSAGRCSARTVTRRATWDCCSRPR